MGKVGKGREEKEKEDGCDGHDGGLRKRGEV